MACVVKVACVMWLSFVLLLANVGASQMEFAIDFR